MLDNGQVTIHKVIVGLLTMAASEGTGAVNTMSRRQLVNGNKEGQADFDVH